MQPTSGSLAVTVLLALGAPGLAAAGQEAAPETITGVVTSGAAPEAGVWVIAETGDLPTKFRKIVVTGDDGRFLLPELPPASYSVWVRGYGLVDSPPVTAAPGDDLRLAATVARTPREAAAIYPASYWLSLLEPPSGSEFPGTGPDGNGISAELRTRDESSTTSRRACAATRSAAGSRGSTRRGTTTTRAPTRGTPESAWGSAGPR